MAQDITEALRKCQDYAEVGYQIARESYDTLHQALREESRQIKAADKKQRSIKRLANSPVVLQQKQSLKEAQALDRALERDLEALHERQKEFSIIVFGRTMAGKSTLMEVITHGSGATIGKGAQRTTRDVRDYHWQGMRVTDVPGICSFEGQEDDELAMEAAKSADLILFLLTDDAPQEDEAAKLADLKALGKPVLGVMNVKMALNPERRALALRNLQKKLADTQRLDAICQQFREYGSKFQQDWSDIPFVYTHLRAAFLGQPSQMDDEEMYQASNFPQVEAYILDKVERDGCFLRIKTFVDQMGRPLQQHMYSMLENCSDNIAEGLVYRRKRNELLDWSNEFVEHVNDDLAKFRKRLENNIEEEIDDFVEDNYENEDAGEAWNETFQDMHVEVDCKNFLSRIARKCEKKRRELSDELREEMRFVQPKFDTPDIPMEEITDTQGWMTLGALGVGLIFSGPLGIAIGVLSWLFGDSKEEKIRQAKAELRKKLQEAMSPAVDKIMANLEHAINEQVIGHGIHDFAEKLDNMDDTMFELVAAGQDKVYELGGQLLEINGQLFDEAVAYSYGDNPLPENNYVLRLPGDCCYVITAPSRGARKWIKPVSECLGERVQIIPMRNGDNMIDAMMRYKCDYAFDHLMYHQEDSLEYLTLRDESNLTEAEVARDKKLLALVPARPFYVFQ